MMDSENHKNQKPKVLIFTGVYKPGFKAGGPIQSVANLVNSLQNEVDFYIITSDRDMGDSKAYPGIKTNQWITKDNYHIFYCKTTDSFRHIYKILIRESFNSFYFNSFLTPIFTTYPLLLLKFFKQHSNIIIAPRGEFLNGALDHKGLKKKIFIRFSRLISLHKNIHWHLTSSDEVIGLNKIYKTKSNQISLVENLPKINESEVLKKGFYTNNKLKIIFLSRVSPKKNLDFALGILSKITIPFEFNIYGVIDDAKYWEKCKAVINNLPSNIAVNYLGAVNNDLVLDVISNHDLFFLPTKSENYGHVIVESLLAGTPVLISTNTPWRGLKEAKLGWDLSLDTPKSFVSAIIEYYNQITQGSFYSRHEISDWIQSKVNVKKLKNSYLDMFVKD